MLHSWSWVHRQGFVFMVVLFFSVPIRALELPNSSARFLVSSICVNKCCVKFDSSHTINRGYCCFCVLVVSSLSPPHCGHASTVHRNPPRKVCFYVCLFFFTRMCVRERERSLSSYPTAFTAVFTVFRSHSLVLIFDWTTPGPRTISIDFYM